MATEGMSGRVRRASGIALAAWVVLAVPGLSQSEPAPRPRITEVFSASCDAQPPPPPEPLPIDLPTVLRLSNAANPTIALARARVQQALARLDQANLLFLPTLTAGGTYYRHDGQTQNQAGLVFGVSRSNVFAGGGTTLRVDVADALFMPLVARQLTAAESASAQAVNNNIQLDVASAYLDLLQVHGLLAINADTLGRAEQMLKFAVDADQAGVAKATWDVNRARTEVNLRRQERLDLQGRAAAVSANLARLLLLEPTVDLLPADPAVVPVVLVSPEHRIEDLVQLGLRN